MEQTAQQSFLVARIIAGALAAGVVAVWAVAWVLTGGGQLGMAPGLFAPEQAFWVWAVAGLTGFGGALVARGRAMRVAE